jgi:uncharacterized protein YyaL (SSP411 family)
MPNRLAAETSPYLRQHAENPVDWYPWGREALERAREEDRPILLSVGYAACHWCHVMAHESFEDPEIARVMNELFVNIKVDREERPDVDSIYMQAVQSMTGHGGWPMTVFLTPAGEPFYAGTYFPPADHQGMPAFVRILRSVSDAYHTKRDRVTQTAAAMRDIYAAASTPMPPSGTLGPGTLDRAYRGLAERFDSAHGGFEGAPKFPQTMSLDFLLRYAARTSSAPALAMVMESFRHMARGGIYDQVGGGFHRYAVDAIWLVPHFEKMLYDNALLASLGVHLWQATADPEVRRVTDETIAWVAREMTSPEGGFYASLDADSEGAEGKFYVWTERELDAALGPESAAIKTYYGVTPDGNFEGTNILHVPGDAAVLARRAGISETALSAARDRARGILGALRERRVRPGRDEKILAAWNGLMLRAVSGAARAFGSPAHRTLALANAEFLRRTLVRPGGRVMRTHTAGVTKIGGYLEDHASVALGFLGTYEMTADRAWLGLAREIATAIGEWFWDDASGTLYDTARDADPLITRPRDLPDNAVPSGTSLTIDLYLHLAELLDDATLRQRALGVLEALAEPMARHPAAFGYALGAADMAINGAVAVALVGEPASAGYRLLDAVVGQHYVPSLVLAGGPPGESAGLALLDGRPEVNGAATAYVCHHYMCEAPQTDPAGLAAQISGAVRARRGSTAAAGSSRG